MNYIAIVAGICAATLQSVSYLFSRGYVMRKYGGPIQLILDSQVFMAVMTLPAVALTWGDDVPPIGNYVFPLVACTGMYIAGQLSLFAAMKRIQASRVSPMLGFKIVVTAMLTCLFFDANLSLRQWSGVATAVSAVVLLNFSGGRLSASALSAVVSACFCYAVSDIYIGELIHALKPMPLLRASIYATGVSYILSGSLALVALILRRQLHTISRGLRFSLPFALIWLSAMFAFFICVGAVGPVLGNILQSSRGVISILIAIPAVRLGFPMIEPSAPRRVVIQRLIAAVLIIAAVWLYA